MSEETTTETQPELIVSEFNEHGVCTNPEVIKVKMPAKPKGLVCEFFLAVAPDHSWRTGDYLGTKTEGVTSPCSAKLRLKGYPSRESALRAVYDSSRTWFSSKRIDAASRKAALSALDYFAERNFPGVATEEPVKVEAVFPKGKFRTVPVRCCEPNPWNRKTITAEEFNSLRESVRREGLLEPIVVRVLEIEELPGVVESAPPEPRYQIIAGEQRWRAHVESGIEKIDAMVHAGVNNATARVWTLVENLTRSSLNPIDEARGYAGLIEEGFTQDSIADRVNRSRSRVANTLRLLKLPELTLRQISSGKLTPKHGEALLRFVPKKHADDLEKCDVPEWKNIINRMASQASSEGAPVTKLACAGVPYLNALQEGDFAVWIDPMGGYRPSKEQLASEAFIEHGTGWVCFRPDLWAEHRATIDKERAEKAAAEAERVKAAVTAAPVEQGAIEGVEEEVLVIFQGDETILSELVPAAVLRYVQNDAGLRVPATDHEDLGKFLKKALHAAIRKDRLSRCDDLTAKLRKKIHALKKLGDRETTWLIGEVLSRRVNLKQEDDDAIAQAGASFESVEYVEHCDDFAWIHSQDPVQIYRVMVEILRPGIMSGIVAYGTEHDWVSHLKWWLDTDTLWLLEETEEGIAELLDQIKSQKTYQTLINEITAETAEPAEVLA